MDHGPPDPKRSRVEAWTNGDERRALPPLNRPHQHQYPPPPPPSSFSRPQLPHAPPHPPVPHQLEDRRHEAGFGPLQQEPQRTMSFTNPMYATYPPREAVVKRDPSSPSPAQYQPQPQPQPQPRPNSTGHNNLEHMSVLHLDDHRRPSMPAYDAPPPPNYHSVPPYHPLGTPTFNPPYEQHAAYGPPPTPSALRDQMYGVAYAESAVGVRRKAPRTSQACKQCRQAKAKCDDPKPCTKCKKEGLVCDYTPPEPKQADKAVNEMMEMLKSLVQRQDNVERVLKLMAPEHEDLFAAEDASKKEEEEEEEVADMYEVQPNPSAAPEGQAMSQGASGFHYQGPMREGPASIEGAEEEEEEGERLPFPNTEPAIPVNHTTPAQRMLRWTGISKYVDAIMKDPKIKSVYYPFNREVKRGLLRLYSRGEGSGRSYSADKESGMVEPSGHGTGDSISTPEASASPDTLSDWGLLNDFSLTNEVAIYYRKGGLNATANDLEVDEATVRRLAGKYMDCINNMHPIILPAAMENMIRQFLKEVPDHKPAATKNPLAGFAGDSSVPFKRKRSVETIEVPTVAPPKARWARRSIHTALMLMILALGKICEHTGPIPDVVHENEPQAGGSAYFRNGYPSPTNASPVVSPQAPSGPSPKEGELRVRFRRGSTGASLQPRRLPATPRNRDVIPGLAYFAEATNILGNQLGGNTIHHVHANILACLYYGQLARVAESHASIHSANRALYNLLKP
ncbi:MAG: hypothetical protein M1818_002733 [Claussenomyces sp. TS43310]|nr:MAG: hypothetical protein M1818_002733 [Claussenomyces sp. TS43310]